MKRLAVVFLLGMVTVVLYAPAAFAHGERSQEAFLRMRTVGWQDITFSGGTVDDQGDIVVDQGGKFTIKGVAKLMNTWPDTLTAGTPEIGVINVATQGPALGMLEKTINGVSTPGRIEITRGRFYDFDMTLMGRRVGRWHIHPTFSVKGAGTVLGPGQWIEVKKTPGGFTSPVKLYNGETINIENYGMGFIWSWQVIGFLMGVIWLVWWTGGSMLANPKWGPKWHRTVTNPAVTLQIPLNDDGVAVGLNKKADHRFVNIMAIVMGIMMLIAWVYQASAYPVKIPQQVIQFEPPVTALDSAPVLGEVDAKLADYNFDTKQMTITADVTNVSDSAIELQAFTTSTLTFVNPAAGSPSGPYQDELGLSPSGTIQPGQTSSLTLTVSGARFEEEHLLPENESQLTVAGLLVFEDATGRRSSSEFEEPLRPNF